MIQDATQQPEIIESSHLSMEEEEGDSVDLVAAFKVLYQHRRHIGRITLVFFLVATALAFAMRPRYTATASFVPPSSSGASSALALAGQLSSVLGAGALGGGAKSSGDLYVGILKSRSIASTLVQRFDLKTVYKVRKESDAEKRLIAQSSFVVGVKDPIVSVSVTDHSPERARDLANGYLEALKSVNGRLALTESSQRRLFFEDRLAHEKDDLANAEVGLKQIEEKTGLIAPAGQTASKIQALAQLRAQIAVRQTSLASLRQQETDQSMDVLRVQSEIASLQSQVSRMEKEDGKSNGAFADASNAQVPALELEYTRKLREVKYHEALFEIIAKQYEVARLDEENRTPLQILDPATLPDSTSGPPRFLIMLGGLATGVVCGCVWVVLRVSKASSLLRSLRTP